MKTPLSRDPPPRRDPSRAHNKCDTRDCRYCPFIGVHGRIISHITGRTYHAPMGVTCKSNNLVYVITCRKCPKSQYVGETSRPFHKRIYEHLYAIGHNLDTSVAHHFRKPGHDTSHIKFEVASFIYSHAPPKSDEGTKICRKVEKLWIHRFKTNRSPGLNILD